MKWELIIAVFVCGLVFSGWPLVLRFTGLVVRFAVLACMKITNFAGSACGATGDEACCAQDGCVAVCSPADNSCGGGEWR